MTTLRARVLLDLGGNLPAQSRRYGRAIGDLASDTSRQAGVMRAAIGRASSGLDQLGNRYVALATGAGAVGTLRILGNLDQRMRALGVQANISQDEVEGIKDQIFALANAPDIRVDPAQLMDAVDRIVEKTGDLDLARENLRNIGLAMRAASADGADVGAMIADLSVKFGIRGPEQMLATLDALVNQGKAGAFTLQNLAGQGERVTAAYGQLGRTGPAAVREMGAALQMIRQGTGSAEQAATALEAVVRTLNDADKVKLLKGAGIKLFDPDEPTRMRSIVDIMSDIIAKTGGDVLKISQVFDAEAMRAFSAAVVEYKQTGGLASFQNFLNVDSTGAAILADAERNAQGFNAALQSLTNAAQAYAETNLAGPVQDLADAINGLDPATVNMVMDGLARGAMVLGGLIAVNKTVGTIASTMRGIRSLTGKGAAGAAAAGATGAAGAMPVIVMNWPMGGMGGDYGVGPDGRRLGRNRAVGRGVAARAGKFGALATVAGSAMQKVPGVSKMAGWGGQLMGMGGKALGWGGQAMGWGGKLLGRAGGPITALFAAVDAAQAIADENWEALAGVGGRLAGAGGGAMLGAAAGSVIPGVGTAIGGLVGGIGGAIAGEEGVRAAYRLLVGVDPDNGQVTVRTDGNADGVEIDPWAMQP